MHNKKEKKTYANWKWSANEMFKTNTNKTNDDDNGDEKR